MLHATKLCKLRAIFLIFYKKGGTPPCFYRFFAPFCKIIYKFWAKMLHIFAIFCPNRVNFKIFQKNLDCRLFLWSGFCRICNCYAVFIGSCGKVITEDVAAHGKVVNLKKVFVFCGCYAVFLQKFVCKHH